MRTRAVAIILLAASLGPSAAAAKIKVPADHATIQAAVTAALAGDVIEVSQGTYPEDVVINARSDLTIQAKKGDKVTVDAGNGPDPVFFINASDRIVLKSLRLEDTQSQGVFIGSSTYVTVRQCALKNTGEDGILVTSSTGVLIDKCSITAPGGDGINLHDCDGCVVQKNKIKNASMEGIEADGDMHTFEANTIDGTGEAGIQVGDGATGCRNALVLGNKITGAGTVGILCFADAQDCSILENSVINSVVQGVIAEAGSDGHVISKNTVRETGDYGVFIDSDFCALLQNTVTESAEDGIRIALGCSGALVSKNTVTKASMSGFSVVGTGNVFVQNKASKSQDYDLDDQTGPEQNIFINNSFSTVAPP